MLMRSLAILVVFCLGLFFRDLGGKDLWSSHEARAAQDAQQMLDAQSWGLPHLYDGQADLQKPPGYYWMVAGIGYLRGGSVDSWAVRLPATLSAVVTVFFLFGYLHLRQRTLAGFLSAAILASAVHFTGMARVGRIDMPLTCAVTVAVCLLRSTQFRWQIAAALPLCIAILLKGPIGLVLPLAVWTGWSILGRWSEPTSRRLLAPALASLLAIGLAAPWFLWANHATAGEFFRVFFWYHNYQRAVGGAPALGTHPWWMYFPRFAIDFLPWTPAFLMALWQVLRNRRKGIGDSDATFGLIGFATVFAVLSFSSFKRADYLLPAYPGAAIFLGCLAERWLQRISARSYKLASVGFFAILIGCCFGWWGFDHYVTPRQEAVREQRPFAEQIRRLAPTPETILLFRVESHLLVYHLGRPVHTLVEWGDLNDWLAQPGTHYFVTRAEFVPECLANVKTRPIELVLHSADFSREPPLRPLVLMRTTEAENKPCPNRVPKD